MALNWFGLFGMKTYKVAEFEDVFDLIENKTVYLLPTKEQRSRYAGCREDFFYTQKNSGNDTLQWAVCFQNKANDNESIQGIIPADYIQKTFYIQLEGVKEKYRAFVMNDNCDKYFRAGIVGEDF